MAKLAKLVVGLVATGMLVGCGGEVDVTGSQVATPSAAMSSMNASPAIAGASSVAPAPPSGTLMVTGTQQIPHSHLLLWKKIELKGQVVNTGAVPLSGTVVFTWHYANKVASMSQVVTVPGNGSAPFDQTSTDAADSGDVQIVPMATGYGGYPQGQGYPATGQGYPSTGQGYPSTGQGYPSGSGQTLY